MTRVFADTSFDVALLSPSDQHHGAAVGWAGTPGLRVVTTEFVLIELSNFFSATKKRRKLPRLLDALAASKATRITAASRPLFRSGLALFRSRPDKDWSLTDCTSFAVMDAQGIRDALTVDHHFDQAGYRALLR